MAERAVDEAFEAFVDAAGAELVRFAYLLCRDAARSEDLVQEALLKMLRRWRSHGAAEHPGAYARKVIANEYLGWRRRRASGEVVIADGPELTAPDRTDEQADRDLVWRLIGTLPPRARAVLVLRYYEHMSDREIAQVLGCAEPTVRSIAARAFASLRSDPQLAQDATVHQFRKEA